MILEAVINVCFVILGGFGSLFPNVSWSVDSAVFNAFFDIIRVAGYLLPMHTVVSILEIVVVFQLFRIVVALIKTVWDLIPFL